MKHIVSTMACFSTKVYLALAWFVYVLKPNVMLDGSVQDLVFIIIWYDLIGCDVDAALLYFVFIEISLGQNRNGFYDQSGYVSMWHWFLKSNINGAIRVKLVC